ncbi:MAG: GNAT family N-acetyltransferase [Chthoniobacterales bacterium]|nr:GNAT family N-acetyltransferase [Chthoniobacterales bacterium]
MSPPLAITPADPFAPESLRLAGALWAELSTLYPEMTAPPFPPRDIAGERAVFMVASLGERAVGCGAVRPLPGDGADVAEIKRMFVAPEARGIGVAHEILRTLEEWARTRGYRVARLETGLRQPVAIRLYERAGYYPIRRYGHHADDSLAVCFEKSLAGATDCGP